MPTPTKSWADTLIPLLGEMRAGLGKQDPAIVAALAGATLDDPTTLRLPFWSDEWLIRFPECTVAGPSGQECPADKQVMLLYYLTHADGTNPAGRWIAFHDLPSGMFYAQAFQGYSGNRMVRYFVNDVEGFERAAIALGGQREEGGDAMYSFWPLPRVGMAAQYWRGDEEFAARGTILFDAVAGRYLTTDALAILGSQLVSRLIKAHQQAGPGKEAPPTGKLV